MPSPRVSIRGERFEVSGTAGNLVRYCEKSVCVCVCVCVCVYVQYSSIDLWLIFAYTYGWNAVPAKSKGYSAWLKSISYSISYSIFGGNRSSTRFLPGKIVLLLDFFYSFTEKRNRSFTRSPTPIFHFVKSIFHPFDGLA